MKKPTQWKHLTPKMRFTAAIAFLAVCVLLLCSCAESFDKTHLPPDMPPGGGQGNDPGGEAYISEIGSSEIAMTDASGGAAESGQENSKEPSGQTPDVTPATGSLTPEPSGTEQTPTPEITQVVEPTETHIFYSSYEGKELALTVSSTGGSFSGKVVDGVLDLDVEENVLLSFSGAYAGGITLKTGEESDLELALEGCTLYATNTCPALYFACAKNADLSAKSGSESFIYDKRAAVEELGSVLYAVCDLKIKGQGALTVVSDNNNGLHSKDDLTVKNLSLSVNCLDNALKGNDSVTVESGDLTLIARQGDGIKTSNSSVGSSGKQKGTVQISGGKIRIYAACDGIDAAYDLIVMNDPEIEVYTDKYSSYSEKVTKTSAKSIYIRATTTAYKYSVLFTDSTGGKVWVNSSSYETVSGRGGRPGGGGGTTYYYAIERPANSVKMQIFIYTSAQKQGQSEEFYAASADSTINESFDTVYYSNGRFNLTNKSSSGGGWGPGPGGEGNRDKGDYSTKGMKAGNAITISGGVVFIQAYDDAIHANSESALESGATPKGSVEISGGTLTLSSNDDGIHADGRLTIDGGRVEVKTAYEGLEANVITVNGGRTVLTASNDGVNACSGSETPLLNVTGGYLDVTVSPSGDTDGIDSNGSYTQSGGVVITRGPNSAMMAALDTERGATVTGGTLIILGYGKVTARNLNSYSISLHTKGSQTVTIGGESYTFENAYSYGKTTVYSDKEVKRG